jgi:hypothetical protein
MLIGQLEGKAKHNFETDTNPLTETEFRKHSLADHPVSLSLERIR